MDEVADETAVSACRIAQSICRSWPRGRCGKFFLNRRSALTKYRTILNDGIQNRKMAEVLLLYKQIKLLNEQKRIRHWSPTFPMMRNWARSARLRPTFRPFPDTTHARDYEYKHHGTVTTDLVTGHQCGGRPAPKS